MGQTIWLARHGNRLDFVYPEWFNTAERRYDPPLSEDGLEQAQKLGKRLQSEPIKHIFSSPFLRAIQTAHPVAEALDLPIKLESGLGEWFNPHWMTESPQVHPPEILAKDYPRIDWSYTSRIFPQYPESEDNLRQRSAETIRLLISEFSEDILLVGHSGSITGATLGLVGRDISVNTPLCCLVKIVRHQTKWEIVLNGDTNHLTLS